MGGAQYLSRCLGNRPCGQCSIRLGEALGGAGQSCVSDNFTGLPPRKGLNREHFEDPFFKPDTAERVTLFDLP